MRKRVAFPLAARMAKLTTILLLAGVSTGCSSDFTRFAENPFTNPFGAQQGDQIVTGSVGAAPLVPVRPMAASPGLANSRVAPAVMSQPISPLVQPFRPQAALPAPQSAPQLLPNPPAIRAAAAAPVAQAVASAGAAKGGIPFTMGEGDTVASVSQKFGLPVSAVLAANGYSDASQVKPGTKLILPVDAARKATDGLPKIVPGGLKPVRPVAAAEAVAQQPEFLFQSGAPFSARAAQIPIEAGTSATLVEANESEAAILRRKLKKLQEEVDALEAAEKNKSAAAKLKKAAQEEVASSTKIEGKKKPAVVADAPAKKAAPAKEKVVSAEKAAAPKSVKPKTEVAEADAPKKTVVKKKVEAEAKVAEKPKAEKPKVAAKKPVEDQKVASAPKPKKKTEVAAAEAPKKEKREAKPVRVIPTAPARDVAKAEEVAPTTEADDNITTAKADPLPAPAPAVDPGFRWPANGRIIQRFDGGANRGVKIALPEGTPVKAARAGKVIYVGEEVKGYGKLVLVRHEDGYVSAYGNNSALLVKRGDTVDRGQDVARSGSTGDVPSPMLHFELRKGAEAVNPLAYLK